jgi:hypothetical protein
MADKIRSKPYYAWEEVMTLRQAWIGFQALILAGAVQFSLGVNVYAQSVELRAVAEAKAQGALQARALASTIVQDSTPIGTYTVFNVPGALDTYPVSINPAGTITGCFLSVDQVDQGFSRTTRDAITTFDAPGGIFRGRQLRGSRFRAGPQWKFEHV